MLRWSSWLFWFWWRIWLFRWRNRFMTKKSNVSETVAVMPAKISQMPMSEDVVAPPNVSSRQMNSQHDEPIWNDLQSGGGVHNTARHCCNSCRLIWFRSIGTLCSTHLGMSILADAQFTHVDSRRHEVHRMLNRSSRIVATLARGTSNSDTVGHAIGCSRCSSWTVTRYVAKTRKKSDKKIINVDV